MKPVAALRTSIQKERPYRMKNTPPTSPSQQLFNTSTIADAVGSFYDDRKKAAAQTLSDQLMAYSNAFARFDPSWEMQAKAFERMSHQVLGLVDAEPRQNRRTRLASEKESPGV
jgi:hypothetical protein